MSKVVEDLKDSNDGEKSATLFFVCVFLTIPAQQQTNIFKSKPMCRWDITDNKVSMKRFFFLMLLVAGIGMSVNAQQCSFEVTDVKSSISSSTVTLTLTIVPSFTPNTTTQEEYEVVVKPIGELRSLLDSQSKSVTFLWGGRYWNGQEKTVRFTCSVEDNSYKQCRKQEFSTSCFKK